MMENITEVRYALPMDLLDQIGAYLVKRPYAEVALIVRRLESETAKVDMPKPPATEAEAGDA